MENIYELQARFDSRKSFYGKAKVKENKNKVTLISYSTEIMTIDTVKHTVKKLFESCSQTTTRHVKEFLKQYDVSEKIYSSLEVNKTAKF